MGSRQKTGGPGIEDWRNRILAKLSAFRHKGLTKSKLGKASPSFDGALSSLERNGKIRFIRSGRTTYVFAAEFAPSLESTASRLDGLAAATPVRLFTASELTRQLTSPERAHAPDALHFLLKEGILFEFRQGRSRRFFLHLPAFDRARGRQAQPSTPKSSSPASAGVRSAYEALCTETGSRTVYLSDLRVRAGVALQEFHAFLRDEARAGRVVLTTGDWAVASPEMRAAALELDGTPRIQARFLG